jgi:hypothetical protein
MYKSTPPFQPSVYYRNTVEITRLLQHGFLLCVPLFLLVRAVLFGSEDEEIAHSPGVAPLVVVPCDELDEVLVKRNTSACIEDGGVGAADEVGGHDGVLGVAHDAFERSSRGLLDSGLDLLVGGIFFETNDEINDRDIESGYTERKTAEN